ncbi:MAG: bile acid:sodium symporter [Prevotella sp.]|nr:bile acid:sodium symporter [Prevotella sp.]
MKKFLKTFTLPVAIAVGTLVYLLFYYVPFLDEAGDILNPIVTDILPWAMSVILFVTFLKLNYHEVGLRKWHLAVVLAQVVLSLMCVGAILVFGLENEMKILVEGMLICIICPSAIAASVVSNKLGGNLTEMTTYTLLSNVVAVFSMPLLFPLIEKQADLTFLSAALVILDKTVKILLMPRFLAAFVKHYVPRLYKAIIGIKDLGFYLWAMMLALVTGVTVRNIFHTDISRIFLFWIALSAAAVTIVQFFLGKNLGELFGNRIDGGQGLGQKNTTLAIWCAFTDLHPVSSIAPGCYILWQNIFNSWQLWRHEKTLKR